LNQKPNGRLETGLNSMAKFIQNGTLRVSVGEIVAYWENYTDANSGLLVMVTKGGDRFAWVQSKEDTKRMAEYLDRHNQIMNFDCAGTWQHVGRLTQDLLELQSGKKDGEETGSEKEENGAW